MTNSTRGFPAARRIALDLPEVEEGLCYGTPGFRVRGKLFARLREDGDTLVVRVDLDSREALLEAHPKVYFLTDHYRGHPWLLVRLSTASVTDLHDRLREAWLLSAPKRLVQGYLAKLPQPHSSYRTMFCPVGFTAGSSTPKILVGGFVSPPNTALQRDCHSPANGAFGAAGSCQPLNAGR